MGKSVSYTISEQPAQRDEHELRLGGRAALSLIRN